MLSNVADVRVGSVQQGFWVTRTWPGSVFSRFHWTWTWTVVDPGSGQKEVQVRVDPRSTPTHKDTEIVYIFILNYIFSELYELQAHQDPDVHIKHVRTGSWGKIWLESVQHSPSTTYTMTLVYALFIHLGKLLYFLHLYRNGVDKKVFVITV